MSISFIENHRVVAPDMSLHVVTSPVTTSRRSVSPCITGRHSDAFTTTSGAETPHRRNSPLQSARSRVSSSSPRSRERANTATPRSRDSIAMDELTPLRSVSPMSIDVWPLFCRRLRDQIVRAFSRSCSRGGDTPTRYHRRHHQHHQRRVDVRVAGVGVFSVLAERQRDGWACIGSFEPSASITMDSVSRPRAAPSMSAGYAVHASDAPNIFVHDGSPLVAVRRRSPTPPPRRDEITTSNATSTETTTTEAFDFDTLRTLVEEQRFVAAESCADRSPNPTGSSPSSSRSRLRPLLLALSADADEADRNRGDDIAATVREHVTRHVTSAARHAGDATTARRLGMAPLGELSFRPSSHHHDHHHHQHRAWLHLDAATASAVAAVCQRRDAAAEARDLQDLSATRRCHEGDAVHGRSNPRGGSSAHVAASSAAAFMVARGRIPLLDLGCGNGANRAAPASKHAATPHERFPTRSRRDGNASWMPPLLHRVIGSATAASTRRSSVSASESLSHSIAVRASGRPVAMASASAASASASVELSAFFWDVVARKREIRFAAAKERRFHVLREMEQLERMLVSGVE